VSGRLVRKLSLGRLEAGYYISRNRAVHWDGRNELGEHVASGVYFYQMNIGKKEFMKKMVMLK
jgi:flagellar hook assembly protein FlgD